MDRTLKLILNDKTNTKINDTRKYNRDVYLFIKLQAIEV